MMAIVIAALRLSGLRNAGTPLDTASTPDRATAPDENARSSIRMLSAAVPSASSWPSSESWSSGIGPRSWTKIRQQPTTISRTSMTTYRYVGGANRAPLSFRPRRLATVITAISARHSGTRHDESKPNADWIASTPPAIDTATVRM